MYVGAPTSFALYGPYRTNTVHEQSLTTEILIRSHIDCLIPSDDNIIVLVRNFQVDENI